jgi:hypothetical protein
MGVYAGRPMESDERRLARNEAIFRVVNREIAKTGERFGQVAPDETYDFVCECADPDCTDPIRITLDRFHEVRAEPTRFIVAEGHAEATIERRVDAGDGYEIVEKNGEAAAVARATAVDA